MYIYCRNKYLCLTTLCENLYKRYTEYSLGIIALRGGHLPAEFNSEQVGIFLPFCKTILTQGRAIRHEKVKRSEQGFTPQTLDQANEMEVAWNEKMAQGDSKSGCFAS